MSSKDGLMESYSSSAALGLLSREENHLLTETIYMEYIACIAPRMVVKRVGKQFNSVINAIVAGVRCRLYLEGNGLLDVGADTDEDEDWNDYEHEDDNEDKHNDQHKDNSIW